MEGQHSIFILKLPWLLMQRKFAERATESEFQRNVKQHDREALWPKIKQPKSTKKKFPFGTLKLVD